MTHTITCELGCRKVIATGRTEDEAVELAEEAEATYYGGDEGPGEWACQECVDAQFREGMAMAEEYDRDRQLQEIIRESRDAQDGMLESADAVFDAARARGEI